MTYRFFCIFLVSVSVWSASLADNLYEDDSLKKEVRTIIDHIYNFEFDTADSLISVLKPELEYHPAWHMLNAFSMHWKYQPIKAGTPQFDDYIKIIDVVLVKCDELREKDRDLEADFFTLAALGYLTELYANNGENLKAVGIARSVYSYLKRGFELQEEIPEYYFTSGIYNYYREKYPEENPMFKPFMWVFMSGDKAEGIRFLKMGRIRAVFTQVECVNYLYHIYLRYENKPEKSILYSRQLVSSYPNNPMYNAFYAENLYCLGRYNEMYTYIGHLRNAQSGIHQFLGAVFYGIYLEKSEQDYRQALDVLLPAETKLEEMDSSIPHFNSYLYASIARCYQKQGQKEKASKYFKKALSEAEYNSVKYNINKDMEAN